MFWSSTASVFANGLTWTRFLDIALVCELKGDLGMAELAGSKAVEVKRDCQGVNFPNYNRYTDVFDRIKSKLALLS
jgi:hypothetical protein